jgi:hypothetical protein
MKQSAESNDITLSPVMSINDMNLKDAQVQPDGEAESSYAEVVALIHPLPEDVLPSKRFMEQMRGRLLELKAARVAASKQAA